MLRKTGVVRDKQFHRLVNESLLHDIQDSLMKQDIHTTGNPVLGINKSKLKL